MKKISLLMLIAASFLSFNADAATIWVDIQNMDYTPQNLYVPVGSIVKWTNYDTMIHTVTSDNNLFDSGAIAQGQSWSFTFNTIGDFPYHCIPHPFMTGVIHVRSAANMSVALNMTPTNPPIVIPASGGSFSYDAAGTNQTSTTLNVTYWTKVYLPNNQPVQLLVKSVSFPAGSTRGATLTQLVPASAPAGTYQFFGYIGTLPDSVIGWNVFTFTKAAAAGLEGTGWESVMETDWVDQVSPLESADLDENPEQNISLWNSPEPFNPTTNIRFTLPSDGTTLLEVYNINGAKVATLLNGFIRAGQHQATFDASRLTSGVYIYRLTFSGKPVANKMMLVK